MSKTPSAEDVLRVLAKVRVLRDRYPATWERWNMTLFSVMGDGGVDPLAYMESFEAGDCVSLFVTARLKFDLWEICDHPGGPLQQASEHIVIAAGETGQAIRQEMAELLDYLKPPERPYTGDIARDSELFIRGHQGEKWPALAKRFDLTVKGVKKAIKNYCKWCNFRRRRSDHRAGRAESRNRNALCCEANEIGESHFPRFLFAGRLKNGSRWVEHQHLREPFSWPRPFAI